MTQREVMTLIGGVVGGVVVAGVLAVALFDVNLGGNTDTEVILSNTGPGGACVLGKETTLRVKKSKNLTWEIHNYCDVAANVTVGNFRTAPDPSSASDCAAATGGNVVYPFTDEGLAARTSSVEAGATKGEDVKPGESKLKLKMKDREALGKTALTYYFDICLDGTKADPTLMVER